jgi:Leucine rich repeat
MMLVVLIVGGILAWYITEARQQANTVAAVLQVGGHVTYDWEYYDGKTIAATKPHWLDYLMRTFGPDYFSNVTTVTISPALLEAPPNPQGWLEIDDALMDRLATLRHIEWFHFNDNLSFTDAKLSKLSGSTRVRKLDLHGSGISGHGFVNLKNMKSLESADLTGILLKDDDLADISQLMSLKVLWLQGDQLTDNGLVYLGSLRNLEWLELRNSTQMAITSKGLSHLATLRLLEHLDLQRTRIESLASIQSLLALSYLDISKSQINDHGLSELSSGLENLKSLFLDENQEITDAGLAHLGKLKGLKTLGLSGTSITGSGLGTLASLTGLEFLDLKGSRITDTGISNIYENLKIKNIDLSKTIITDRGLALLLRRFAGEGIDVTGTNTTPSGNAAFQKNFPNINIYNR